MSRLTEASAAVPPSPDEARKSARVLWMSTIAFTVCFSVWTLYSILAIKIQDEIGLTGSQFGTLLAVPILVGSLSRLPVGMLTDRFGGGPSLERVGRDVQDLDVVQP